MRKKKWSSPGASSKQRFVPSKNARVGLRGLAAETATAAEMAADRVTGPASVTQATRDHCVLTAWTASLACRGTRPTASAQVAPAPRVWPVWLVGRPWGAASAA